jgi:hypothetical protein
VLLRYPGLFSALTGGALLQLSAPPDRSLSITHPAVWGFLVLLGLGVVWLVALAVALRRLFRPAAPRRGKRSSSSSRSASVYGIWSSLMIRAPFG